MLSPRIAKSINFIRGFERVGTGLSTSNMNCNICLDPPGSLENLSLENHLVPNRPRTGFCTVTWSFQQKPVSITHEKRAAMSSKSNTPRTSIPTPSPSASIILVSPQNEILLLQRVKTSKSFASAHVFPGGHVSAQDGEIPPVDDIRRYEDSETYRMSAVRECFEESGILLAKNGERPGHLLTLTDAEREDGRHAIHQNQIDFREWVAQHGGTPDLENLIPFTHWLSPLINGRRFSTQMYLYFLPIIPSSSTSSSALQSFSSQTHSKTVHSPKSDGGIEHTAARFLHPSEWLSLFNKNEIILFPPQFFLLHLISPFLSPSPSNPPLQHPSASEASTALTTTNDIDTHTLNQQREALIAFTKTSTPPWTEKFISPRLVSQNEQSSVIDLRDPGPELRGTGRGGEEERVIVQVPQAGKQHRLEVRWRRDVLGERNRGEEKL